MSMNIPESSKNNFTTQNIGGHCQIGEAEIFRNSSHLDPPSNDLLSKPNRWCLTNYSYGNMYHWHCVLGAPLRNSPGFARPVHDRRDPVRAAS